jgi:hypothetical protein
MIIIILLILLINIENVNSFYYKTIGIKDYNNIQLNAIGIKTKAIFDKMELKEKMETTVGGAGGTSTLKGLEKMVIIIILLINIY